MKDKEKNEIFRYEKDDIISKTASDIECFGNSLYEVRQDAFRSAIEIKSGELQLIVFLQEIHLLENMETNDADLLRKKKDYMAQEEKIKERIHDQKKNSIRSGKVSIELLGMPRQ